MLELHKNITINARPETVFRALTDPDRIPAYFPVDSVKLEARVGGLIELTGAVDGQAFTDYGNVECFDAPSRFAYRYWSTNHGTERTDSNHMTIEFEVESDGACGSNLRLRHSNLLTDQRLEQMNLVWDVLLGSLKGYVEES